MAVDRVWQNCRLATLAPSRPGLGLVEDGLIAATRLTVDECIAGVTREAARALGMGHAKCSLEAGKDCDLAIWDIERPAELVYRIGFNPLHSRVFRGTA